MADGSDDHFRKRDMIRQLRAFGNRRLMFRIVDRIEHGSRTLSEAAVQGRLSDLDLEDLADMAYQRDLRVAPGDPSGLVTLTGVSRDGVRRIEELGLEPCCVVRGPAGQIDAWVQLGRSEDEVAGDRGISVRLLLTTAAQRLTALAGGDPRTAHYAQGGYVAGVFQSWSRGDVAVLSAEDRAATAAQGLLDECAGRIVALQAAADAAAASGVDCERETEMLVSTSDLGIPLEALYRRQAAVAKAWGVTEPAALDRSVAAAAARQGAPETRIRALLKAGSPMRGSEGFAAYVTSVIEAVFSDATTVYAASKTKVRAERTASEGEIRADGRAAEALADRPASKPGGVSS